MKITILAVGTRGDVQPLVALGRGLQTAGHTVRVACYGEYESLVRDAGLNFFPLRGNPAALIEGEAFQAVLQRGNQAFRTWLRLPQAFKPAIMVAALDSIAACRNADAVLYSTTSSHFAPAIAERLNMPAVAAFYQPMHPTRAFPSLFFRRALGGPLNRLTWVLGDFMFWLPYRSVVNRWRRETLNLPSIPLHLNYRKQWRRKQKLILFGISPSVLPRPADWSHNIHVTGYWFLDRPADWRPPADVVNFLAGGARPVYIGFGSLKLGQVKERIETVLRALRRTNQRGLLALGDDRLTQENLPPNVLKVGALPHDWLFPQVACTVHHGGAGTTAVSLRAGVPTVTVPFYLDQFFWADRITKLGTGPKPIPAGELTADTLTAAIESAVKDTEIRLRARVLSKRIQAENGIGRAVQLLQLHFLNEHGC